MTAIRRLVKSADGLWIPQWPKAPKEVEGYGLGWLKILGPDDFIVNVSFDISDPALVEVSHNHTRSMSVIWVVDGALGSTVDIDHIITSDTGRRLTQPMRLQIVNKSRNG